MVDKHYRKHSRRDLQALYAAERAILAAFNTDTGPNLPKTRFRVATVMVATRGEVLPECTVKFSTAATVGGGEIAVDIDHEEGR